MNREQAKGVVKHFEVVKAYAEGKAIQYRPYGTRQWIDSYGSLGFMEDYEYRVKPKEPMRVKLVITKEGRVVRCSDSFPLIPTDRVAEFVEVVPEDKS